MNKAWASLNDNVWSFVAYEWRALDTNGWFSGHHLSAVLHGVWRHERLVTSVWVITRKSVKIATRLVLLLRSSGMWRSELHAKKFEYGIHEWNSLWTGSRYQWKLGVSYYSCFKVITYRQAGLAPRSCLRLGNNLETAVVGYTRFPLMLAFRSWRTPFINNPLNPLLLYKT